MLNRSLDFVLAQRDAARAPLAAVVAWTLAGARVYSYVPLTDAELWANPGARYDGTWAYDGTTRYGGDRLPVISREARILSISPLQEDGGILPGLGLLGRRGRTAPALTVTLRNDDGHFGHVLATDVFLSAPATLLLGFRGMRRDLWRTRHQGIITEQRLNKETFVFRSEAA